MAEAAPYLARFDSQAGFDYAIDLALDAIVARQRFDTERLNRYSHFASCGVLSGRRPRQLG